MGNIEQIKASGVLTKEMKALLVQLQTLINYARQGGKQIEQIWKIPRPCGLIHYEDSEPSFDGVALRAPSAKDFKEYIQQDAFGK